MNCRDFLARHSEYVDGVIEAAAAESMTAHTRGCTSCARYDRLVRRGGVLVRDLPVVAVSPDFEARMRHRLFHARDDMAQRRAGSASAYVAVASVVLALGALGVGSYVMEETPVVEAQVVFAAAPRAYTPVQSYVFLASATPRAAASRDEGPVSPIGAESLGHDSHLAEPLAWPVYSRDGAAAAFPKSGAELVVKPAEFRPISAVHTAGPILVRH